MDQEAGRARELVGLDGLDVDGITHVINLDLPPDVKGDAEASPDGEGPHPEGAGYVPPSAILIGKTMAEIEKEAILTALQASGGNRRKAAERLDIGERTLYDKLKVYGLS